MAGQNGRIKYSDDPIKQIQIENELMKMQLQAELGATVHVSGNLAPETEHAFLKMVFAMEGIGRNQCQTVYELIGKPQLPVPDDLPTETDCEREVLRLLDELDKHQVDVMFREDLSWREMLSFLVNDLMQHTIDRCSLPNMRSLFFYDSFYPGEGEES